MGGFLVLPEAHQRSKILNAYRGFKYVYGWIPEWPKGTDCKSAANCFGGSNPPPSIKAH